MRQPSMLHAQPDGSTMGKVEDSALFIGTSVGNPHIEMFPIRQIDDTHNTAERYGSMSSRQRFHIEQLAVRRLPAMKRFAIPRSDASIFDPHIQLPIPFRNPRTGPQ